MDLQDAHGVSRIGSKLRYEIRRNKQSFHKRKHIFWKRQAYALWCAVVILIGFVILW
ncbi:hypothetical protein [Desulfonatronovibrio magnus]|uniref:hypothetical protein n=1 Tax=Desulfonatronovibrio magnus TaxID=698827 RepID=UPI0012FBF789|nr:hypothetical protein [Desulfonatronovibrio magnus]